jgi:hypothetical protein
MTKRTISRTPVAQQGIAGELRTIVGPGYQFPVAAERLLSRPTPPRR